MRWTVLLATFALWLGSMLLVYLHCRPVQFDDLDSTSRAALDRMFAENAVEQRAWKIYVDPSELDKARRMITPDDKSLPAHRPSRREWSGFDESALVLAGRADSRVKNKHRPFLNLEEETSLKLELPGTGFQATYSGSAYLSFDKGLESSTMALKFKYETLEIDAISSSNRDGDELVVNTNIQNNGKTVSSGVRRQSISGNAALNADLAPFQHNPNAKPNQKWTILMFDMDLAMSGDSQGIKPVKVRCYSRTSIMMHGEKVEAFEVRGEDDPSVRAWYSPDGVVLKQVFKLAGVLEVILVREEPAK